VGSTDGDGKWVKLSEGMLKVGVLLLFDWKKASPFDMEEFLGRIWLENLDWKGFRGLLGGRSERKSKR